MKSSIMLVALLVLAASLNAQKVSTTTAAKFSKLSWLEGGWNRTGMKPNQTGQERWKKNAAYEYLGKGVNLKGTDTVFVEKIKIIVKNDTIFYIADVPENKSEVYFRFTSLSTSGFTCENPKHDFPKKIEYQLQGDKLKATISGDGKAIDYWFERIR